MLYTKKGDTGTTKLFDCSQGARISKSSFVFEILGMLDELNSSIGYVKALANKSENILVIYNKKVYYTEILENFQQSLFCIQAELGGSDIHLHREQMDYLEKIIYEIETLIPPITSFVIPGGGETGAYLDILRTISRRAERGLVKLYDSKERKVSLESLAYMNRLSSGFYALARFVNYQEGYTEHGPKYK